MAINYTPANQRSYNQWCFETMTRNKRWKCCWCRENKDIASENLTKKTNRNIEPDKRNKRHGIHSRWNNPIHQTWAPGWPSRPSLPGEPFSPGGPRGPWGPSTPSLPSRPLYPSKPKNNFYESIKRSKSWTMSTWIINFTNQKWWPENDYCEIHMHISAIQIYPPKTLIYFFSKNWRTWRARRSFSEEGEKRKGRWPNRLLIVCFPPRFADEGVCRRSFASNESHFVNQWIKNIFFLKN